MSLTAWRITKRKHAKTAFDGSGARKFEGRWNSPGTAVVYTAQSQSLAVLEVLVHLDGPGLLHTYTLLSVEMEESLVQMLNISDLPRNWRHYPAPIALKKIGDDWVSSGSSVALKAPSVLLPAESNFLLNPLHPDFNKIEMGEPIAFEFDARLTK